jgi:hypothetical protein
MNFPASRGITLQKEPVFLQKSDLSQYAHLLMFVNKEEKQGIDIGLDLFYTRVIPGGHA